MEPIKSLDHYNNGMRKSLIDKIFFVDKVPSGFTMLDFGCADGTLIEFMEALFGTQNHYVGYDFDPKMIQAAWNRCGVSEQHDFSYNYREAISHSLANWPSKTMLLNLSSVIHEIYSYSSYEEVERFWQEQVFDGSYTHIVIRDMVPRNTVNRQSYPNDVKKIYKSANPDILQSFQNRWGSVENLKNLMHFLLKYRYVENWNREVRENYLPLSLEDLYKIIPNCYDIIYQEHYCLPFLHEQIREDFDIEFSEPTHLKMILRKRT
jgi:hypothetical protein